MYGPRLNFVGQRAYKYTKTLHMDGKIRIFAPQSPDGGIGRRVGLKHRWSNPYRFDPGSGHDINPLTYLS